ncbi:AAA family ATPase [Candidatus Pacearchaeota archaeon]|nr:AAA family ATPase [Candidatus Pacearchaeota archaeon]
MGKVIGVISLKGGVGKTSSVVALGDAIAGFGKKVLLVDGNFSAPNLGLHLNVISTENTLHDILRNESSTSDSIISLGKFDLLPADLFNKKKFSPLVLKNKIKYLKRKYDVILVDSSPSLDDETLAVMLASDELIVVTTPDLPTLGTTMKAVKLAKQRGTPIIGLILNKVYDKKFEIPIHKVEENLELPVMAVVPHDSKFVSALSSFEPYTTHRKNSEGSQEFFKLAATLLGEEYKPLRLKRFFRWKNPRKQDINRTIFYESFYN